MANLINSFEGMVEASVKGLLGIAEGYMSGEGFVEYPSATAGNSGARIEEIPESTGEDIDTPSPPHMSSLPVTIPSNLPTPLVRSSTTPISIPTNGISGHQVQVPVSTNLIQATDVPSGWIHLQSAYLDDSGSQKKVKWFGLRCLVGFEINVEISSDLGAQLCFWIGDDEKTSLSSATSTNSSISNTAGSTTLNLSLSPLSFSTIYLAFQPLDQTPPPLSPLLSDGGVTPRVAPVPNRTHSSEVSSFSIGSDTSGPARRDTISEYGGSVVSTASGSTQSVGGSSIKSGPATSSRGGRLEPVHRSFSVHGSISIRASSSSLTAVQQISLPFFATVCRSLFTAALIDPITRLTTGTQQSSGQLILDFGSDSVVGGEYHRDILLVNRSEIELIWTTAVVNSRFKDQVWFSLRDLDSENVFGIGDDRSTQPIPLPALSSRHLRIELRVKQPVVDFDFDFVISNIHTSGNTITCKAIGSGISAITESSLKILSGNTVDFGQIVDGIWGKKMITCKNDGERPLDVQFSATAGFDVCFRLAGVAGEDMDEDLPVERERVVRSGRSGVGNALSRSSTREKEMVIRGRERDLSTSFRSRNASPSSSLGRPGSFHGGGLGEGGSVQPAQMSVDLVRLESNPISGSSGFNAFEKDRMSSDGRDLSLPPSRPLSRVTSRASSHRYPTTAIESDDDEDGVPFFTGGDPISSSPTKPPPPPPTATTPQDRSLHLPDTFGDEEIPNQIEELTMRPGTEYRVFVLYKPKRDLINPPEIAGQLRNTTFKVYLDSQPSSTPSLSRSRRTLNCLAESCTSLIEITSGNSIDFGNVTVGASKSSTIAIKNLSALSARVEIAAISKVLSANRNVIVVPPFEVVEERLEFFPRRINERYEKQVFVRNLLNRSDDQLIEVRSKNVDVYNVTLHSHLYRILTPSGSNFLDFGSVVINSPTVRTIQIENLTTQRLTLELSASQPEDVEMYIKLEDVESSLLSSAHAHSPTKPFGNVNGKYTEVDRIVLNGGELKERFMESLQESEMAGREGREGGTGVSGGKGKIGKKGVIRDKSVARGSTNVEVEGKQSVAASVAAALKKGGRGRPVLLYGNAVVFKDRNLLENSEYLDLASGPPVASHRASPRSKRTQLLDTIELEDRSKLSGQHPRIPKLDFAASAKATGLRSKDVKSKKPKSSTATSNSPVVNATLGSGVAAPSLPPNKPVAPMGAVGQLISALSGAGMPQSVEAGGSKSPALTAKRAEPKTELFTAGDISKLTVDELILSLEQHDSQRSLITHSTPTEEEAYVRRTIALRKELQILVSSGKLVSARMITIPPEKMRQLIVIMTPNGSIRPHVTTRPKRADSRVFIKLLEFDRKLLGAASLALGQMGSGDVVGEGEGEGEVELPVRDLVIRSSCVRSVLEVQQSSINFGACEKGEVKSKTIVIHNKSDCVGIFRMKLSGSIASGSLKLGLGRYGVISAFGRKEVENFTFTPSLVGNFQETIVVQNVLDGWNDQNVSVKAAVRKLPSFGVEPASLDFGNVSGKWPQPLSFILTNISKHERTFLIEVVETPSSEGTSSSSSSSTSPASSSVLTSSPSKSTTTTHETRQMAFAQISLIRDDKDAGTALSQLEEEELEALLQKLKIARRKGKTDKIAKYIARLGELGVSTPLGEVGELGELSDTDPTDGNGELIPSGMGTPAMESETPQFGDSTVLNAQHTILGTATTRAPVTTLSVSLQPSQKHKILVELVPRSHVFGDIDHKGTSTHSTFGPLKSTIRIYDRKNTDETLAIAVSATSSSVEVKNTMSTTSSALISQDPLHLALMRHCLELSNNCPVSPTAFCVGSTLFISRSSDLFLVLEKHFPGFKDSALGSSESTGLILADGYSRQIPGNTHAEANALTNFRNRYTELASSSTTATPVESLPPIETVLKEAECFATMEPCSVRTSGRPSCSLDLVRAGVKAVYLGVEEPPDFVECEGARILEDGGVKVIRVVGLEEDCLKAARRGR